MGVCVGGVVVCVTLVIRFVCLVLGLVIRFLVIAKIFGPRKLSLLSQ